MNLRVALFFVLAGFVIFGSTFWWMFGLILTESGDQNADVTATQLAPLAILVGAATAYFVFVFTSYLQGRAARAANALTALQALRTDRDYLERATAVANKIGGFSRQIDHDTFLKLTAPGDAEQAICPTCKTCAGTVVDHSLMQDVDFMLNQYEFLAAAARLNALEIDLLRNTIRSTVLGLMLTFEPYIKDERGRAPNTWQNLVWLAQKFDRKVWNADNGRLGPPPRF